MGEAELKKTLVDPEAHIFIVEPGEDFPSSLSPLESESEAERWRPARLTGRPSPRSSESTPVVSTSAQEEDGNKPLATGGQCNPPSPGPPRSLGP